MALAIAYIFYRSLSAFLILFMVFLPLCGYYARLEFRKSRDRRLSLEFRDTIASLSGYLSAGYSVENAFLETYRERAEIGDKGSIMKKELELILKGIGLNKNIEDMLTDFAVRSGNQDIRSFAFVFALTKRNGGNMREVILRTVNIIRDKTSVEEDIRTSIRGVRYEQLIMTAIPFFIVFYMNLSSGSFFSSLYEGLSGRMIMSLALLLIALGFGLSNKICDIRV